MTIEHMRNIGISAHIDSGKTTLTERILFYSRKIHAIHEVRGKDGVGATMDSMELERERGITIASAATNVRWNNHDVNIIDTPGHVDFTIEVERALRVLDGAILVLCAVGGVQSQTLTVDRQLKRYKVPRIAFINKCDRVGSDPLSVTQQLEEKLGHTAVLLQLPIGLEQSLKGVIDLVEMKALYFDGPFGEHIREEPVPDTYHDEALRLHEKLIDTASLFSDDLAEAFLEGNAPPSLIRAAIRKATVSCALTPVFLGSAYKNVGVQPLLDAVVAYLPHPADIRTTVTDCGADNTEVVLEPLKDRPAVALAFKLEEGRYGQLTYVRIYQGMVRKGDELVIARTGKKLKLGRLIRMHADSMEELAMAGPGDIVAFFGIDCVSGDTFTQPGLQYSFTGMFVPEPVISLAVFPQDSQSSDAMAKALGRFTKEDPTFRTFTDPESKETVIQGMGELHLDVYIERMRREYAITLETGMPQVAYRETIEIPASFDYTHKKQTGGAGQYGRVVGLIEPNSESEFEFVDTSKGGVIPAEYISACERGFQTCLEKGSLVGFPVTGIRVILQDGNHHAVDSSDIAFYQASITAFRQAYTKAKPLLLEPIMTVSVEGPTEFQGVVLASLNQRRGQIVSVTEENRFLRVDAHVPLAEMFGYSTGIRSLTQGKCEFTMEFYQYSRVPRSAAEEIISRLRKRKAA